MEIEATIRFTTPSLGDLRGEVRDAMRRDTDGKIIYLQSWWRGSLRFAAQAVNRFQKDVEDVQANPLVEGQVGIYKRYYNATQFKEHEAFLAGSEIKLRFLLPNTIPVQAFKDLLSIAGEYVGISPYGFKQNFGRFIVIDVKPYTRRSFNVQCHDTPQRTSDSCLAGPQRATCSDIVIQQESADGRQSV